MFRFFRKIRIKLLTEHNFSRYFTYALGEILLVVVGILIALSVDNWNTDRQDQRRMEKYAKSLIQDLQNDIAMIRVSQAQARTAHRRIDSLRNYFSATLPENLSNTDLFLFTHDIMYRPYKWNRSTLEEIKASGSLRYIDNDSLKKKIIEYESFSHHLDADYESDKSNADRAHELMAEILNLNSPYFDELRDMETDIFESTGLELFQTEAYKASKREDTGLISREPKQLSKFLNTFIQIQGQYGTRSFLEMPEMVEDAQEIIALIQEDYNLPPPE